MALFDLFDLKSRNFQIELFNFFSLNFKIFLSSKFLSSDFPDGSPIMPVAPPSNTTEYDQHFESV